MAIEWATARRLNLAIAIGFLVVTAPLGLVRIGESLSTVWLFSFFLTPISMFGHAIAASAGALGLEIAASTAAKLLAGAVAVFIVIMAIGQVHDRGRVPLPFSGETTDSLEENDD